MPGTSIWKLCHRRLRGTAHQQVTDAYLLALARRHEATFVTFDGRMKHLTAPGAALEVLGQPAGLKPRAG
jgi:hypothetical protein